MSDTQDVKIQNDSAERVAFDLMSEIAFRENATKDRTYYLTLYRSCYKATNGWTLKQIFETEPTK